MTNIVGNFKKGDKVQVNSNDGQVLTGVVYNVYVTDGVVSIAVEHAPNNYGMYKESAITLLENEDS